MPEEKLFNVRISLKNGHIIRLSNIPEDAKTNIVNSLSKEESYKLTSDEGTCMFIKAGEVSSCEAWESVQ